MSSSRGVNKKATRGSSSSGGKAQGQSLKVNGHVVPCTPGNNYEGEEELKSCPMSSSRRGAKKATTRGSSSSGGKAQGQSRKVNGHVMPCIPGNSYEGEEELKCPKCSEELMWYCLPNHSELLACPSPMCAYPFEEDSSAYIIRPREISTPPEADLGGASLVNGVGSLIAMKEEPGPSNAMVEYGQGQYDKDLAERLVREYLDTPVEENKKPAYVPKPFVDVDAANLVHEMLTAMNDLIDE